MVYSEKYKFLFIAIPKTGTVSVQDALIKLDPNAETGSITIGNKIIKGKHLKKGVLGHARATELKEVLGEEIYDRLHVFAMIRNPYDKLVSAYFFTKKNSWFLKKPGTYTPRLILNRVIHFFSVLMARTLPFETWALCYPYRSNYGYIFNEKGERIVEFIGRTECLEHDLNLFLKKNVDINKKVRLKQLNKSKHKSSEFHFRSKLFKKLISYKLRKDLKLYDEVNEELKNYSL